MPDKLALLPREYVLGEVALAIVPKRSEQPQRDIKAVAREWLTPLWDDYGFQLHRHLLQHQVIPAAARRFPLTILMNGIVQPASLANPLRKLIWSLAERIADPEHERSLVGVDAYPDGSRQPFHVTSAEPFALYSAIVIDSTAPLLRAFVPPSSDYRERLWIAIALLQPAGSLAELLETLPLPGAAFYHDTETFVLYPDDTPEVDRFYKRATAGYERRSEGLPWDGRHNAGRPAAWRTAEDFRIDVAAARRTFRRQGRNPVDLRAAVAQELGKSKKTVQRAEKTFSVRVKDVKARP